MLESWKEEFKLYYRGTVIWNSLSTTLTEVESLHDFKLRFLAMLLIQCMYVVNNYIVCLFVQGTAEKQLADAVSLVKKLEKKKQKKNG